MGGGMGMGGGAGVTAVAGNLTPNATELAVDIPDDMVGRIIGKQGMPPPSPLRAALFGRCLS